MDMTVRRDLENRIKEYEDSDTIIGDVMAMASRSALIQMCEEELNREIEEDE
jgi:hypothetical protein